MANSGTVNRTQPRNGDAIRREVERYRVTGSLPPCPRTGNRSPCPQTRPSSSACTPRRGTPSCARTWCSGSSPWRDRLRFVTAARRSSWMTCSRSRTWRWSKRSIGSIRAAASRSSRSRRRRSSESFAVTSATASGSFGFRATSRRGRWRSAKRCERSATSSVAVRPCHRSPSTSSCPRRRSPRRSRPRRPAGRCRWTCRPAARTPSRHRWWRRWATASRGMRQWRPSWRPTTRSSRSAKPRS